MVATGLTQAANDKQQVTPIVTALKALPELWGEVTRLLAVAGYCRAANVSACVTVGIEPLLAVGREAHHLSWHARFSEPPRCRCRPSRCSASLKA